MRKLPGWGPSDVEPPKIPIGNYVDELNNAVARVMVEAYQLPPRYSLHPFMVTAIPLIGCEIDYEGPNQSFGGLVTDVLYEKGHVWFLTDYGYAFRYDMPCQITILERHAYGLDDAG